jgi:hypothetical protein
MEEGERPVVVRNGFFGPSLRRVFVAPVREDQRQVAETLRLLRAQFLNPLEEVNRRIAVAGLRQPVRQNPQQLRVFEAQLGQIGQNARGEFRLPAPRQMLGAVEVERGRFRELLPLGQVNTVGFRCRDRLHCLQVGHVRRPLLENDRRRGGGLFLLDPHLCCGTKGTQCSA